MYAAFSRLNYKPWFALAEFVDNAIQSHMDTRVSGIEPLKITIAIDHERITIHDSAAGIPWSDFPRAFTPATPPPNRKGLSEFGLGMKAAACWFADEWTVRTKVAGDTIERSVVFDVPRIVSTNTQELTVIQVPAARDNHYTVLTLSSLRVKPKGRTLEKIYSHLSSIYRRFLTDGSLAMSIRYPSGEERVLAYESPAILEEPYHESPGTPVGPVVRWQKPFSIELAPGKSVNGWAGILKTGSLHFAGFSVFRRQRLIVGSHDETYRPTEVFGAGNTYTHQRLFGELNCRGFQVSHTKDGVDWDGLEEKMLDKLNEILRADDMPLLRQVSNFRHRTGLSQLPADFGASAVKRLGEDLQRRAPPVIARSLPSVGAASPSEPIEPRPAPIEQPPPSPVEPPIPTGATVSVRRVQEFNIPGHDERWRVTLEIDRTPGADWYVPILPSTVTTGTLRLREVGIRLNLAHPFSEQFVGDDELSMAAVTRVLVAMAVAGVIAQESGGSAGAGISYMRSVFNNLLRDALADQNAA